MILGDLLDARVLDPDGEQLGYVVDVRLELELREQRDKADDDRASREHSEPDERPLAQQTRRRDAVGNARVVGLLVSPRTGSSFLGYEREQMRSPWMIAAIVRARHRGTFLVAWQQVAAVEDGRITLADGYERLSPKLGGSAHGV